MANYHFEVQAISRGQGRSLTRLVNYISGERLSDCYNRRIYVLLFILPTIAFYRRLPSPGRISSGSGKTLNPKNNRGASYLRRCIPRLI